MRHSGTFSTVHAAYNHNLSYPFRLVFCVGSVLVGIMVVALAMIVPPLAQATETADAHVIVHRDNVINPDAPRLMGTSFDGRTSLWLGGAPGGYYSPFDGSPLPEVAPLWNRLELTSLRYPGNAVNKLNWQESIGPIDSRPPTDIGGGPQKILFGFDEFMAMAEARGVPLEHVQIMINLYSTYNGQTPAENAADWVEYANAPYDPSGLTNPNGDIDWAAVRAANGHPQPYDIKIWNIGNEPWGQTEFNMDVISYTVVAADFISRMKAVDPTIKITLPAAGAPTQPTAAGQQRRALMTTWDTTLLQMFGDDIYGLSQHLFYDRSSTCRGVGAAQQAIHLLAQQIADSGHNVQLLIGDHAHTITSAPTICTQPNSADFAMQWQGAVTTADFLMMLSGETAVERANFWIFGMPAAVWHPIRRNNDGSYTSLPLAGIYELFTPLMWAQAISTTTTSPASADDYPYSIRTGAFRSPEQNQISVILVNRDQLAHTVSLQGLDGYSLQRARLLTAVQPDSDSFIVTDLPMTNSPTEFDMPGPSILLLEFEKTRLEIYLPVIQK